MKWRGLWILLLAHGLVHGTMNVFPVVLEPVGEEFGWSLARMGWVGTLGYGVFGIMAWPGGYLADWFDRRRLLIICLSGMLGGSLLMGMGLGPHGFLTGWVLLGAFAGLYHPLGLALVAQDHPELTGEAMGWHGLGGNLGFAFMPALAGLLASLWGWPAAFLGAVAVLLVPWLGSLGVRFSSQSNRGELEPVNWTVWLLGALLIYGLVGLIYRGLVTFLPLSLDRAWAGGLDLASVGGLTTVVLLLGALGQYLGGRLEDHVPSVPLFGTLVASYSLLLIIMPFTDRWLFLGIMGLWCLLFFAGQPVVNSWISRFGSVDTHGRLYGYAFLMNLGFGGLGAGLAGMALERYDLLGGYWILASLGFLVLGLIGFYSQFSSVGNG